MLVGNLVSIVANDPGQFNEIQQKIINEKEVPTSTIEPSTNLTTASSSFTSPAVNVSTVTISNVTSLTPLSVSTSPNSTNTTNHNETIATTTVSPKLQRSQTLTSKLTLDDFSNVMPDLISIMQPDALYVADFVIYGFFFISFVQVLAIISGANITNMDFIFSACGLILYLAVGSKLIAVAIEFESHFPNETTDCGPKLKATGSFCIITSLLYLVDGIFALKEINMN